MGECGFDVSKGRKSLGRATWQQVGGVTAGGKVSGWDVAIQAWPGDGAALAS